MRLTHHFRILYVPIVLFAWTSCQPGEDTLVSQELGFCPLIQLEDNGLILNLNYDQNGILQSAGTNFGETYSCSYDAESRLQAITGTRDIRIEHVEGTWPERIALWQDGAERFHFELEETQGKLTRWSSFPNAASLADRILELEYSGDRFERMQLQLYDKDLERHVVVMEADSIVTDGKLNPFSSHMLLFILFMEDKPFAFGAENIVDARIEVLGQPIPFNAIYSYNDRQQLTHSKIEVQLFGGETQFHYRCF